MRIFHRAYSLMFITMCFIPFVKSQRTYEVLTTVIITKKCLLTYHYYSFLLFQLLIYLELIILTRDSGSSWELHYDELRNILECIYGYIMHQLKSDLRAPGTSCPRGYPANYSPTVLRSCVSTNIHFISQIVHSKFHTWVASKLDVSISFSTLRQTPYYSTKQKYPKVVVNFKSLFLWGKKKEGDSKEATKRSPITQVALDYVYISCSPH